MKTIWMRVGMSVSLTDDELDLVLNGHKHGYSHELSGIVERAISEGRVITDGETYIPENCIEMVNADYGTSYDASTDIETYLTPRLKGE